MRFQARKYALKLLEPRVERIPQGIPEQIHPEHGEAEGDTGEMTSLGMSARRVATFFGEGCQLAGQRLRTPRSGYAA